jgi:C-terminal processing protease CtpA/Prc
VQRFVPKLILVTLATFGGCASDPGSIGAVLAQSHPDGKVTLREVPSGYPAAEAGLAPNDEILLIDGRDVRSLSPDAIHRLLEGQVGTAVNLTVLRRGKIERVAVKRAPLARSPLR